MLTKRSFIIIVVVFMVTLLTGCGGGSGGGTSSLIGTWRQVSLTQDGQTVNCPTSSGAVTCGTDTTVIKSDGTFVSNGTDETGLAYRSTGTWTANGNTAIGTTLRAGQDANGDGQVSDSEMQAADPTITKRQITFSISGNMLHSQYTDQGQQIIVVFQRQ